jgi:hypothetical protein
MLKDENMETIWEKLKIMVRNGPTPSLGQQQQLHTKEP